MFDFLEQFLTPDIVSIIFYVLIGLYIIKSIFEFFATRNLSKLKKSISEVETMISKFRLPNYQETDEGARAANVQSFTRYTPKYVYNEDTKTLELAINKDTGEILQEDDQAKIDSYRDTALDKVLERFLPQDYFASVPPLSDEQFDMEGSQRVKDLSDYSSILDLAETYREKYGLDSDMTCIDVFNFVGDLNNRYKDKIKEYIPAAAQPAAAQPAAAQPAAAQQMSIDYDALAASILKMKGGK